MKDCWNTCIDFCCQESDYENNITSWGNSSCDSAQSSPYVLSNVGLGLPQHVQHLTDTGSLSASVRQMAASRRWPIQNQPRGFSCWHFDRKIYMKGKKITVLLSNHRSDILTSVQSRGCFDIKLYKITFWCTNVIPSLDESVVVSTLFKK